ncbi:MAG: 2,3-bisphosphoglycerate-independent phosphoglycerate mutase [Nitrospira sp.]|nr:2,3-bisphosphoglycerate-independent phosphoglycerate mutase [Nitrospira sp.]
MLIVLDGWGIGSNAEHDAIKQAEIPFYDSLIRDYPNTSIASAAGAVGLPEGQMGNSEVGHLNLGAGRIVYQDYAKINKALDDGSFYLNPAFAIAFDAAKAGGKAVHLFGLLSDGGVHSHINHLYALIKMAETSGVKNIFVHAFMDGRDTPPSSAIDYINDLEKFIKHKPSVHIASVTGRFWVMDRDERWDRVEQFYNAFIHGTAKTARSGTEAVQQSYDIGETDEFIKPTIIVNADAPAGTLQDGDSVIFFNFRADRVREISRALTAKNFDAFERGRIPVISSFVTMTRYEEDFDFPVAFPPLPLNNLLGGVLSQHNLTQLRIAETEKYAHVTYFFNGGEETEFAGEDRCLIPSPKEVATYDLKPEMSAYEVTDKVLGHLDSDKYDFILLNFANPDMVGHTGIMSAAVRACEVIDECLKKIVEKVLEKGGVFMITADHGNCEKMIEGEGAHTAHTTNLVPFILGKKGVKLRERGILADVAPTVLYFFGIESPGEMTGMSLIDKG